jgi:hypothetical protein
MSPVPLLYPSLGLTVDEHKQLVIVDEGRIGQEGRQIPFALYWSSAAATPMPIVVLSHGGAYGKTDARKSMDEWAPLVAEHGYLAVAIAHVPRTDLERIVLTMNLGGTLPQCAEFKYLGYDRPIDFALVVRELIDRSASPPLAGLIDTGTVGYMGHSSGGGSALMAAGAGREYMPGLGMSFAEHALPQAFIAMSPQGAGEDGFLAESWNAVSRPVLLGTGAADGDHPHERRDPFEYMPAGDKYQLWIEDQAAKHTLFEGELDACEQVTGNLARCEEIRGWLAAAVRAFLDAYLRGDPAAIAYLASGDLVTTSGGVIEWDTK